MAQTVKCLPTMRETQVPSLGQEDPLEKEMATHSSILAWKIPWTEELDWLLSMGSQRVRHDWATSLSIYLRIWLIITNSSLLCDKHFSKPFHFIISVSSSQIPIIYLLLSLNTFVIPILQGRKVEFTEVKWFLQGHQLIICRITTWTQFCLQNSCSIREHAASRNLFI